MANNGLQYTGKTLPFGNGLQQGTDVRSRPDAFLDIATDVSFDDAGGLQTRLPYVGSVSPTLPDGSIFGGGVVTNVRRIVANGDELVLFTKDKLYSWNEKLSAWVLRATHLAVSTEETPRFATTGDQVQGDRAELLGTVVYAWVEGTQVYAAAMDKVTGSVLVSPTAVSTAIGRPRLVALATKIMLFVEASSTLLTVRAIDPAAPGTAIAGAGNTVLTTNFNLYYDVVRAGTQDLVVGACRRQTTTSYTVFTVTPALVVTAVTKARTCDGPIAVATIADGTKTQIVRGNGANVQGDLLTTSTLADVFTAQAIGTRFSATLQQITAEFVSTTARVFWSSDEDTSAVVKTNTVTTANVVGTQAVFSSLAFDLAVASRAFAYDGSVYVWLVFAANTAALTGGGTATVTVRGQLQNTYFLYRDDGLLVSRAAFDVAGGFSAATGHLPGVALTDGSTSFTWCAQHRRVIELGGVAQTAFGSRSPMNVGFTFDDDAARRCVRLGQTLYVAGGGLMMQYDGAQLVELGFQIYPYQLTATVVGAGTGAFAAGTFSYQSTLRWTNASGEQERSTTAIGIDIPVIALDKVQLGVTELHPTRRTTAQGAPAIEWWRTEVNPPDGAPFYLITSKDPTATSGDNKYLATDVTATGVLLVDNFTDAILVTKEQNPENGDVLENLAPPGASIIKATDTRLYLWGIPGDPDRFWYSKQRDTGQIAAFHDSLTARVPAPGGRGTSLWFQGQVLYVARETAIYAFTGVGKDNLGQGQGYSDAQEVSLDVGVVNDESVAWTPLGTIFKSRKGWYLCTGNGVKYIGAPVKDFDAETVLAVNVLETKHEVRILTASRLLVWDYHAATQESPLGQWGQRSIGDGVHATMYDGAHVLLVNDGTSVQGIKTEATTYSGVTYGMDVETAWIKPTDLQGAIRVRKAQPLGEFRSACLVRVRVAYNYEMDGTTPRYVDDKVFNPADLALVAGNPLQFAIGLKRPSCTAVKVRITAIGTATAPVFDSTTAIPFVRLTGSAGIWTASISPTRAGDIGEIGNRLTVSIAFDAGTPFSIDVRDDFRWDQVSQIWAPAVNNVGVRVVCSAGSTPLVSQLEAAIIAQSTRALTLVTPDASGLTVDAAAMAGLETIGAFTDGFNAAPTGEAIKLTGLGLEVGYEPGLFRRLKSAQKL